jgi:uncharacterized protein (TIGR02145 family)
MKIKFYFLINCVFVILLFPGFLFAQGEFDNWYFGKHAGLNFSSGSPIPVMTVSSLFYAVGSTITVSDSIGHLLFYGENNGYNNSEYIYNRDNNRTPNGNLINGNRNDNPQPLFVVKKIAEDSVYYIFSVVNPISAVGGLNYSVFDMRLDGGLGDVVPGQKSIPIYSGRDARGVLTGTRHHNNKDAWIVVHNLSGSNSYLAYLINSDGIDTIPVISPSFVHFPDTNSNMISSLKITPDGTKLVFLADSIAEYCSFNSTTGTVTHLFNLKYPPLSLLHLEDAEFSIDNKYLYIDFCLSSDSTKLYQFDVSMTDSIGFTQSKILINSEPCLWNQYLEGLQRGPDNRIYCLAMSSIDSISLIRNPSLSGTLCDYQKNAICLLPTNLAEARFPQFLQKYYIYIHHSPSLCSQDSVSFTSSIWPPADSIKWNFGDPASGVSNFSTLASPAHTYSNAGTYTVELYVRHNDRRTDTTWQTITIAASPNVNLGPNRTICIGDSSTFDAGACGGCTYQWKNLGTGLIVGTGQTYKTGLAGSYSVTVTNSNNCIGSDTVHLFTSAVPSVTNNPLSESICSGNSTNISLTSGVPGTLFHWTASLTSGNITGFSADSGLVINQVLIDNLTTPGIATYSITPKVGSCSGSTVDYQVTVTPGAPVSVSISASQNNVCAGTSITYTAVPTNGGANPAYQWKVNGTNSGTNSITFTYTPVNNDIITCVLTSSLLVCISNNPATSNAITMTVNPLQPVSVNVSPSQNPVCAGASVTFTATPTNGGTSPSYQWKVNGTGVGTNSSTYTYTPVNGDIITCVVTSNAVCPTGNPATSNTVTMTVNPSFTLSLTIAASANPFCLGSLVTFTATPTNGGTNPAYQWKVNGVNAGTNSSTYSYNPNNGDSVRCIMTSNLTCVTNNPASSLEIIMSGTLSPTVTFTSCFDTITTVNSKPIKLKGGIPLGGTYSGPGVNSLTGIFTPSTSGTGTKTITYTYTNVSSCSAFKTIHIIVQSTAVFSCGNTFNDIRDGKTYPTVQIGTQCWMAANLNYGTVLVSTQDQRDNCLFEKYCYNDNPANCTNLGALYQWDEMMQYDNTAADQGFCPPGWHIPTENDWNTLFANYINNAFAGNPLKYSGYSGFNALLSGENYFNKSWNYQGFATFFWSSTSHSPTQAWAHGMNEEDPSVSLYPASRENAFSVRCIHD